MPTTSNFGWTTPADTDLVKDGAAAIRTLGNGIDTSLVDLKGGTTGQILSKASNTDLDYTWITNDQGDITEVQAGTGISVASGTGPIPIVTNTVATTFDAKGDLVVGTGADTFAKLTLGANNTVLTADSTTATGLKWAAAAGGGKVLQVVNATYSTETSNSTTSYVDTGLTATITPTANTSKILITYSIMCSKSSGNSENAIYLGLLKGASEIHNNPNIFRTSTAVAQQDVVTQVYYDSPATTSATTYKVNFRNRSSTSSVTVFADSTVGTLTLMEIGA